MSVLLTSFLADHRLLFVACLEKNRSRLDEKAEDSIRVWQPFDFSPALRGF